MKNVNLNIEKTLFIAKTVNGKGEEQYLTVGKDKGIEYPYFKTYNLFNPLSDIGHNENEFLEEDFYILKGDSLEEIEWHLQNCKNNNDFKEKRIQILRIEVKMDQYHEKHIYYSLSDIYKNIKNFEKYFVSKKFAKENGYNFDKMKSLRSEVENKYNDPVLDNIYQSWMKLEDLE